MEIEELFCKRYPEYSVNGKPLSPYFDVFEEGYEQAETDKQYWEQKANRLTTEWGETLDQLTKAKEMIKNLYEGLDKLYLSGLSDKQIAFIEQLQDKTEQFLKEIEK